jgi:hypothetical protein
VAGFVNASTPLHQEGYGHGGPDRERYNDCLGQPVSAAEMPPLALASHRSSSRAVCVFNTLSEAISARRSEQLTYFVYDLLRFDGHDLRRCPIEDRKALLRDDRRSRGVGMGSGILRDGGSHFTTATLVWPARKHGRGQGRVGPIAPIPEDPAVRPLYQIQRSDRTAGNATLAR